MYQNGTNTITQGCGAKGQIYMNYVSFATLHTTSYIQLASTELHFVFSIFQDNHEAFKDGRYRSLYEINGPALSSGLQWPVINCTTFTAI